MKNPFKKSKFPKVNTTEPRSIDEIRKDYERLSSEAGQVQYQIYVYKKDLEQKNQRLMSLNNEAAERNKLDQAEKAKEPKETK